MNYSNLSLKRSIQNELLTVGVLSLHINNTEIELSFFSIEPPFRNNTPFISCILPGSYAVFLNHSKKFGNTLRIEDKNNRSNILFHAGNSVKDTNGCILLGTSYANKYLSYSKFAIDKLYSAINAFSPLSISLVISNQF